MEGNESLKKQEIGSRNWLTKEIVTRNCDKKLAQEIGSRNWLTKKEIVTKFIKNDRIEL